VSRAGERSVTRRSSGPKLDGGLRGVYHRARVRDPLANPPGACWSVLRVAQVDESVSQKAASLTFEALVHFRRSAFLLAGEIIGRNRLDAIGASSVQRKNGTHMFLDHEDAKKYPKCKQLMVKLESSLKHQPDVLKTFFDLCKASDQPASDKAVEKIAREKALRYGAGPRIKVHEGLIEALVEDAPGVREIVEACGTNNTFDNVLHKTPVFIEITSFWFDAYEFGYDPLRAGNRLTRDLLHELVHWVRGQTKASERATVPGRMDVNGGFVRGETGEAGDLFEKIAYATRSVCNDDEIFDALISYRVRPH